MNEQSAQKLIRKTLQNAFDKGRFVYLVKNIFNNFEEGSFTYQGKSISNEFADTISIVEHVGKYQDSDEKHIDILIVHLAKDTSLDRARTKQRNFVAKHLKGRHDSILKKDAALVAFVAPNVEDWRFSLVKMEYKFNEMNKVSEVLTPARRYSFLVGKNENSHTAQSQFLPILCNDEVDPTLEKLEEAFSVERVTKEFFEKYRDILLRINESLDDIVEKNHSVDVEFRKKKIDTTDFSKNLLGQIVFLYFLQKKGWFGVAQGEKWGSGSKHFLRELFEKKHGDYENFLNDILEPLFYEALNTERTEDYYSRFRCRIPFLNGGLFEPLNSYDWVNIDVLLPENIFSNSRRTREGDIDDGILDIFDRYNFTVKEDDPLEKEVAVDPEMLGKVFENLLEVKDRKSKGTYYTPREIVHYMCQESLISYLAAEFEGEISKDDFEAFIKYGEAVVGHGDFDLDTTHEENGYIPSGLPKDIEQHARYIDEKIASIRICDPAVGSGAFPVGMMNEIVRARNILTVHIDENDERTSYNFKREVIQNCLYGVDIDPSAVEIAKLRLWLSLIVDEEERYQIQPLPNLDYKIVQGNSLLGIEKGLFDDKQFKKLEELKPLYFNETRPGKKQMYRHQIDEMIDQITRNRKNFDFKVYFSEVFHEKKGFDVVIANPPYVKEYVNRSAFDRLKKSPYYKGKMDLWYMFACEGIDILRCNGVLTFIAQNNWVTSDGASKMRDKVIQDTQILCLIDFGAYRIFEAGIQTMIMMFQKNNDLESHSIDCRRLLKDDLTICDAVDLLRKEENPKAEYFIPRIKRSEFANKILTLNPLAIGNILEKIYSMKNFMLNSKSEIAQGIVPNPDVLGTQNIKKISKHNLSLFKIKKGEGIFVVPKDFFKDLNIYENKILKPLYEPNDLERYFIRRDNSKEIIYSTKKVMPSQMPTLICHLEKYREIMKERRENKKGHIDFYHLHWPRDEYFFESGPKILAVRKCARPIFTYTENAAYVMMSINVIRTHRISLKYLTGILNSRVIEFYLRWKGKMQGTNFQIDKEPLLNLPLIKPDQKSQNEVVGLVDEILTSAKNNKYYEICEYTKQIDQIFYKLYNLTVEEIKIVEDNVTKS